MDRTIAFIGLGTMGRPMASNLLKGGFTIRAFDIVPGAVDARSRRTGRRLRVAGGGGARG